MKLKSASIEMQNLFTDEFRCASLNKLTDELILNGKGAFSTIEPPFEGNDFDEIVKRLTPRLEKVGITSHFLTENTKLIQLHSGIDIVKKQLQRVIHSLEKGAFKYINSFFNFGQLRDGILSLFKGRIRPAITGILFGFINLFVGCLEVFSHFIPIASIAALSQHVVSARLRRAKATGLHPSP